MPVFGLPSALESSLNSLVDLRPPTSWRVSGHGRQEVTVVVRWTLHVSSPSSEKTLHYDEVDKMHPTATAATQLSPANATTANGLGQGNFPVVVDGPTVTCRRGTNDNKFPNLVPQHRKLQLLNRGQSQGSINFSPKNSAELQGNAYVDMDSDETFPVHKRQRRLSSIPYRLYRNPSYSSSSASQPQRHPSGQDGRSVSRGYNKISNLQAKRRSAFRSTFSKSESPICHVISSSPGLAGSFEIHDSHEICSEKQEFKENTLERAPQHKPTLNPLIKTSATVSYQNRNLSGFHHIEANKMAIYTKETNHPCHTPKPLYARSVNNLQPLSFPENEESVYLSSPLLKERVSSSANTEGNCRINSNEMNQPTVVIDVDSPSTAPVDISRNSHNDISRNAHNDISCAEPSQVPQADFKKVYTQIKAVQHIVLPRSSNHQRLQISEDTSADPEKMLRNGIRAYLAKCGSGESSQLELSDLVDNDHDDDDDDDDNNVFDKGYCHNNRNTQNKDCFNKGERKSNDAPVSCERLNERNGILLSVAKINEDVGDSGGGFCSNSESLPDNSPDRVTVINTSVSSFQKAYISSIERQFKRRMERHASVDCDGYLITDNGDEDVISVDNVSFIAVDHSPHSSGHVRETAVEKEVATLSPISVTKDQQDDRRMIEEEDLSIVNVCEPDVSLQNCECHSQGTPNPKNKFKYSPPGPVENAVINGNNVNISHNMSVSTSSSTHCEDELSNESGDQIGKRFPSGERIFVSENLCENHPNNCNAGDTTNNGVSNQVTDDVRGKENQIPSVKELNSEDVDAENIGIIQNEVIIQNDEEKDLEECKNNDEGGGGNKNKKAVEGNAVGDEHFVLEIENPESVHKQYQESETKSKASNDQCETDLDCQTDSLCPNEESIDICEKHDGNESNSTSESHYLIDLSPEEEEDVHPGTHALDESHVTEDQTAERNKDSVQVNGEDCAQSISKLTGEKDQRGEIKTSSDVPAKGDVAYRSDAASGDDVAHHKTLPINSCTPMVKKPPHRNRKRRHIHASSVHRVSESPPLFYPSNETNYLSDPDQTQGYPSQSDHSTHRKGNRLDKSDCERTPPFGSPSKSRTRSTRKKKKRMMTAGDTSVHNSPNYRGNSPLRDRENVLLDVPSSPSLSEIISQSMSKRVVANAAKCSAKQNECPSQSPSISSLSQSPHKQSSSRTPEHIQHSSHNSRDKHIQEDGLEGSSASPNNIRVTRGRHSGRNSNSSGNGMHCLENNEYSFSVISQSPQVSLFRIDHKKYGAPRKRFRQESHDSDCPAYVKHKMRNDQKELSDSPKHNDQRAHELAVKTDLVTDGDHARAGSLPAQSPPISPCQAAHRSVPSDATTQLSPHRGVMARPESLATGCTWSPASPSPPPEQVTRYRSPPGIRSRETPDSEVSASLNNASADASSAVQSCVGLGDNCAPFDKSSLASSPSRPPTESPLGFACESFEHLPEGNDINIDDSSSDEASIRPPTPLPDVK
ncbi:hypothetical protein ElyMa_007024700 [Elysia marginata]|uniref:Uncharacterized protein n=1 Tax=Elysia marginata TaxID=1093978 RepID=A0AAV4JRF6_9GAST|nr:hypothetical protein ElyMa_007024700 [Elysia marginata]